VGEADQIPDRRAWGEQAFLDLQRQVVGQLAIAAAGEQGDATLEGVAVRGERGGSGSRRGQTHTDGVGIEANAVERQRGGAADRRGDAVCDSISDQRGRDAQQRAVLRTPGQ
jgi:hypothetical protein